jgi:UDP-N-acetylmuramoylalanine--D-glutamate ligase
MTIEERIRGRNIGIIGMARSGLAAALLTARFGGHPFVSDSGSGEKLADAIAKLKAVEIPFETGGHSERLLDCDYLILSPGVPLSVGIIKTARERGIPCFSEVEFASWVCKARIVAVTGSNGKTTTTTLLGAIFKNAGFATEVCGNIGRPFSDIADSLADNGVAVVEISSYQLETIADLRPKVAMILNLQPDHLDRHGSFEAYKKAKYRIAENQRESDFLITNIGDPETDPAAIESAATRLTFSIAPRNGADTFIEEGWLYVKVSGEALRIAAVDEIRIKGRHNLQNAAAAALAASLFDISTNRIASTLRNFAGVEHRQEPVGAVAGVQFINDSKATNVDATIVALQSMTTPVFLICGGRDKGFPYTPWIKAGKDKIKGLVAIGEAKEKIFAELGKHFSTQFADTLEAAVLKAFEQAEPGDTVLLSPGCASFDMFDNFEARGRAFKDAVAGLRNGKSKDETVSN